MKVRRSTWLAAAALAFVLVAGLAVSQTVERMHMGHGDFEQHILGFMTRYLDLTDAQQTQVKQIFAEERPRIQPLLEQLGRTRHQLRQLEESGTFDEAKVRAVASQQAQTMVELTVEKAKIKSQVFNILNPDQKDKAEQFMDRREERFERHLHQPEQAPAQQQ